VTNKNPGTTDPDFYDYLIIGSGAGGCAAAHRLAQTGRRVLLLERGKELPRDGPTTAVDPVLRRRDFHSTEPFHFSATAARNDEFENLGGKTKWYGASLLRFTAEEFLADESHQCPPWPCTAAEFQHSYGEAERLLGVRHFPVERDLRTLLDRLHRTDPAWQEEPQPLGLLPEIGNDDEVRRFDGFTLISDHKADAENRLLAPIRHLPNVTILTETTVKDLLPEAGDSIRLGGVRCADGRIFRASSILLGAGAMHSCRLLARYVQRHELAAALPAPELIGRYFKYHIGSLILAISPRAYSDRLRKTISLLHPEFPHSIVQSSAWIDGELIGARLPAWLPRFAIDALGRHAYAFLLMTEDGSHRDNRVTELPDGGIALAYDHELVRPAIQEHQRLRENFSRTLLRAGYFPLRKRIARYSTSHASGTLVATADPQGSVVDSYGRVLGLKNLRVVDASVFPRIGRGNPALTVFAWALRVAEDLAGETVNSGLVTHLNSA